MLNKNADLGKMVHRKIVHHDEFCNWLKLMYVLISVAPCIYEYRFVYTAFFISLNIQCKTAMFSFKMNKLIHLKYATKLTEP
jgi:hypothetical protein